MATPSDINDAIEPGSTEYGDREVIQDRISQSMASAQSGQPGTPGKAMGAAQAKLASGPVSDLPVTDGLSVGPGAGPAGGRQPELDPIVEKYRLVAVNARSPVLRKLARNALRASTGELL